MKANDHIVMGFLRAVVLAGVILAGLLSILGTTGGSNGGSSSGDDPPGSFADAGPDRNIGDGITTFLDGTGSNTPLGAAPGNEFVAYFWEIVSAPPSDFPGLLSYQLDDQNSVIARMRVRVPGEYIAQLRVNYGGRSAFDTVTLTAYDGPRPPNSDAGADQFVKHGALVTLDGTGSEELEELEGTSVGNVLDYQWFIVEQPQGSNPSLSPAPVVNANFIAEYNADDVLASRPRYSQYRVRLHAIDTTQLVSKPTHVNVFVSAPEGYVHPTPVTGPRQRVLTGSTVNLDATNSYDVDGRPLSYDWQFYARAPGSHAVLNGANTATPSFVADADGVYVMQLVVNNGRLSSLRGSNFLDAFDTVVADYSGRDRVVVIARSELNDPVPDAGPDRVLPYTGAAAVALDGSASYDADGHLLTYKWLLVDAPEGSAASIDNAFDTAPDSASLLADVEGTYVVGLSIYPVELYLDQALITLTSNRAPDADAGPDQVVDTSATAMLDGVMSSDPDGDALNYSWSLVSAPDPWGLVDGVWHDWPTLTDADRATPNLTVTQSGDYVIRLTVNDGLVSSIPDIVRVTVASSGACAIPLNLMTTLPFSPELGEVATNIRIDGTGLSAVPGLTILDSDVYQARIPDGNNLDQAEFVILLPATWEEVSRTHANPVSDVDSPSFVVRRISDDIYYKLDIDFTGTNMLEVQIDALSGCLCGNSAASCPL